MSDATAPEVATDVPAKLKEVTREDVEDLLALAARVFLGGRAYFRFEATSLPDLEVDLRDETITVDVRGLDQSLAWRLAEPPEVAPPTEHAVLSRWRLVVKLDGEPVAALGRGVPGVQVRTGRASALLFRDFLWGVLRERARLTPVRRAEAERGRLEEEIRVSRERAGAVAEPGTETVEPGQEALPGPAQVGADAHSRVIDAERRELRERYR